MGAIEIALAAAALLIGATGTFSPCGLSAIETIGPTGHTGGRRTTVAACATFLPGSVAGGLLTFGLLAAIGGLLHGAGGSIAYLVAAAIALLAAVLEARGTRIVPQIRRQLPEQWRRVMPMPLAAALYGLLLGIGFTTFVLSFGVWALAGVSLALGEPSLGLLIGAAFGIGRAIPIIVLAPAAGSPTGIKATELICERPNVYLWLRRGDATVLMIAAVALAVATGSAGAAGTNIPHATDPAATADSLLFERLDGPSVMSRGATEVPLPGAQPAIGGRYIATVTGDSVQLLDRNNLAPIAQVAAPGADAIAVSDNWLAYRVPTGGGDGISIRSIANPASPGPPVQVAGAAGAAQLSRPAVEGSLLIYGVATPARSRIVQRLMGTPKHRALVRSRHLLLFDPSIAGRFFSYVRTDSRRSRLMVRARKGHGPGRVLFSLKRSAGLLFSQALTDAVAYVTTINPSATGGDATIVEVSRREPKRLRERAPRGGGNHRL